MSDYDDDRECRCPGCFGTGRNIDRFGDTLICPDCGGSGWIEDIEDEEPDDNPADT